MSRSRCNITGVLIACLSMLSTQAYADEKTEANGERAYDATTHVSSSKGMDITSRTVCDGKGHKRLESKMPGGMTSVTIVDLPNKKTATIIEQSKMVMLGKLGEGGPGDAGNVRKKVDVKALGSKTIDGHPCKGESFTVGSNKYEVWTGTDIDYPVKTVVQMDSATTTTELKTFSTKQPAAALFEVPKSGYKVVSTN
ncbi:MAG TPA: DUF4412 domain-containing protein [Oculatellaceae cyanobacterium]